MLSANYPDSEGEEEKVREGGKAGKVTPVSYTDSEGEEEKELRQQVLASVGSNSSRTNTPVKKLYNSSGTNTPVKSGTKNQLVSYSFFADDEDSEDSEEEDKEDNGSTFKNPVPMDICTDEEVEIPPPTQRERERERKLGIALPPIPSGKPSQQLQDKVARCVNNVRRGNKDYDTLIQRNKEFRNPSIYEKLIDLLDLDEMGSNYPLERFDPHMWTNKESYYEEIALAQKELMEKREKERKEKANVDGATGTKKETDENPPKKRKTRFDC